jgi:hypothetical protein
VGIAYIASMSIPPKTTHALDQLGAALREVGAILGRYRAALIGEGVPSPEAWALVQRLEERLMGSVIEDVTERAQGPPWER